MLQENYQIRVASKSPSKNNQAKSPEKQFENTLLKILFYNLKTG